MEIKNKSKVTEHMLAGDLRKLILKNPDYSFGSVELLDEIYKIDENQLCEVKQEINSKVVIKSVEKVTKENVED